MGSDTDEIPDETYDSLLKIFDECVENDLSLMLREGLYAELAEWYGCDGAETAIEEWMVDRYCSEAHDQVTVDRDGEEIVVSTENFYAVHPIDVSGCGINWSRGTLYHNEHIWDRDMIADEIPYGEAMKEAEKITERIAENRRTRHPSLTVGERNPGL